MAFFLLRAKKYGTDNARFGKMLYNRNGNLRNRKGDDIEIQAEIYGRTAVPCHGGIGFRMRKLQYRGETGTVTGKIFRTGKRFRTAAD